MRCTFSKAWLVTSAAAPPRTVTSTRCSSPAMMPAETLITITRMSPGGQAGPPAPFSPSSSGQKGRMTLNGIEE